MSELVATPRRARVRRRRAALLAGMLAAASTGAVATTSASAEGSAVPTWQVVAPRILDPVGVAVDAAGDYFVDEPSFQGVEEITPTGSMTVLDQSITEPGALFVTDAGTVYVADNETGTIYEITSNDTVSVATAVPDPEMGSISQIAVSSTSGTIWFTQYNTLWEAQPGGAATNSGFPYGSIAADDQGYIYDTDPTAMEKIAPDGTSTTLPAVWAGAGTVINSDAAGDIYADGPRGNGGIRYGNTYYPQPEGGVWNVAPNGDVVEADTSFVDRITSSMATTYVATQDLTQGLSLVTAPDGNVQVGGTETLALCQVEVSPSGTETPAASSTGATENCGGNGLVAGGGGTPTDPWNQEFFYLHMGGLEASTEFEDGGGGPVQSFGPQGILFDGIASNGTNNVWTWTGQGAGTEVEKVAYPSGTVTDVAAVPYVTALGVDAAGDVFAGYNGSKLEEIPADGGTPTVLSTSLVNPAGITIDSSGNLWVTSGNEILEDVGGALTQVGPDLPGPTSIAFDSSGNLYALTQDGVEELVQESSPPPSNPAAPSDVVAAPAPGSAAVSWDAPESDGGSTITSYTATASPGGQTCTWSTGPLTCTVTGLTNGAAYTFTVTATNAKGTGPASSPSSAVTPATSPDPPTGVHADPGFGSATASWVAPASDGGDPVTSYLATASPTGQWCSWTSGPLSCTISGLNDGDSYTITVTATSAGGTSAASAPSAFVVPAGPPGPPLGAVATAEDASALVTWSQPSDVDAGDVGVTTYTATASPGGKTCTWTSGPLTCTVSGLTNGTAYTFTVDASNFSGTGPGSAPTAAVTPATVPNAPTDVGATAGNAAVTVTWTAPVSSGGSVITDYTATTAPGGKTCSWSSGPLRCTVTGLTNGDSYTFSVAASNAMGTGPASSPSSSVTLPTVPTAPTGVGVTAGDGSITVRWSDPDSDGGRSITGYTATATPGGKSCTTTGTLCVIDNLSPTTSYTVSVIATNAIGESVPGATPAALYPYLPSGLGIEVVTPIISSGAPFIVIAGGASPGDLVTVDLAHAAAVSCTADAAGQCSIAVTEQDAGEFVLHATSHAATSALRIYVPLVSSTLRVIKGGAATIVVSHCPSDARVIISISDNRRYAARASARGKATFRVTMPSVGRFVVSEAVDGVKLEVRHVIVVT